MKLKLFSFTTIVFLFTAILHAQSDTTTQAKAPFAKGTKALLFQISNNFTLRSFEGGLISFKRHFSEKNALRIGLSFSGNHDELRKHMISIPVDSINSRSKYIQSDVTAGLYVTFVRYLTHKSVIKNYFGMGVYCMYNHHVIGENYYTGYSPGRNTWALGPLGVFGVEWFPHPSISLNAEYSCSGKISYGKYYTGYEDMGQIIFKVKQTTFGYGFGEQNVRFGLSVYL